MSVSPGLAFEQYCTDPVVQQAIKVIKDKGSDIAENLLRDAFMAGAKYAIERCKAEHHQPKKG